MSITITNCRWFIRFKKNGVEHNLDGPSTIFYDNIKVWKVEGELEPLKNSYKSHKPQLFQYIINKNIS
jgi:hypothetical protein